MHRNNIFSKVCNFYSMDYEGKVFLAGGAVRDELMGIDAKDLDFVINMDEGGIKFAEWATKKMGNFKSGSNPVTFETYGTAKFNLVGVEHKGFKLDDMDIDCVMPRTEEYEDGSRKPKVDSVMITSHFTLSNGVQLGSWHRL